MAKNHLRLVLAATAILTLSACGGGGSPTGTIIDMGAVTGSGASSDPYTLPLTTPPGTNGGIADYYAAGDGYWKTTWYGQEIDIGDGVAIPPVLSPALLYDTATDTWTANVDGSPVTLAWDASEGHFMCTSAACGAAAYSATLLNTYGDGVTEYGALGILRSYTEAPTYDSGSVLVAYYGLRTIADDMPQSGGATYSGTMHGFLHRHLTQPVPIVNGTVDMTATFTSGGGTLDIYGTGELDATGVASNGEAIYSGGVVEVFGPATIAGNSFSGTISSRISGMSGAADATWTSGFADGAFFGPAADEVVASFKSPGDVPTNSFGNEAAILIGGFTAAQTP
ncbi:MAG: transferrin-binding protein-like solute binding protein [Alphaproteobacteria bacterium]|nr:transferrin-binding protein-like solute binding protein [Alphaproteobacteria bacterium]